MRLRHKKGAEDEILISPYCIHIDNKSLPQNNNIISSYFESDKPIYIELGMGKGKFICEMAKNNPEINFIGVEKYATIVLKAIENYKKTFENLDKKTNLYFLCDDIFNLTNYFEPHSINKIFLNFSDPWPKRRHENKRLTHQIFLDKYATLLEPNGILEFKTDNTNLFNFSLEEIKKSKFELQNFTYDLHNDNILNKNNIMTEYEEKFSKKGNCICKLVALLKKTNKTKGN